MLPLHRGAHDRTDSWHDVDPHSPASPLAHLARQPATRARVLRFRLLRTTPRTALFLTCGALVALWFLSTQLPPDGFPGAGVFRGERPFPPPPPPPPHHQLPPFDDIDGITPVPNPDPVPGSDAEKPASGVDWAARAEKVKEAFVHAYHGYEEHAMPADELLPLTNGSVNNFNGWGVTAVDALDTMYLMGLHAEFERGVQLVAGIDFAGKNRAGVSVPFFETVIRYLGGLLSAYGLSHDAVLLRAADTLGAALLPAFNTTSGLPTFGVNTVTGVTSGGWGGYGTGWLAEVGSCMMEYKYLAKLTGRKEYYAAADGVMQRMYEANTTRYPNGLLPTMWNLTSGQPVNNQISIGAMADSAYEYFLKQYLLTNQTEPASRDLYLRSMRGILSRNLYLSPARSLLYVTDIAANGNTGGYPSRKFEHLSCFLPGLLALGAARLPRSDFDAFERAMPLPGPGSDLDTMTDGTGAGAETESEWERHVWAAQGLGVSCAVTYADMPTGLGADEVMFASVWEREWTRLEKERKADMARQLEEAKKEREREQKEREREREALDEAERAEEGAGPAGGRDMKDGVGAGSHGAGALGHVNQDPHAKQNGNTPNANAPNANPNARPPQRAGAPAPRPTYKPITVAVNQTEEDEKLRWANVLAAWRTGRYDGAALAYVDLDGPGAAKAAAGGGDVPGGQAHAKGRMGPVPGIRDPPPLAPLGTDMRDYRGQNSGYYLRPETIESFFILWRTTGDEVWRERGWAAFEALERESRTESGYATLQNVFHAGSAKGNSMPSYFLAETLKYLYLLFSDEALLPLDKYVLNTEAHPFPVFEWTDWEKEKFGIQS